MESISGFVPLEKICYISWGLRPNSDERYYRGLFRAKDLISETQDKLHPKPYVESKDTVKWWICRVRYLEWGTKRAPAMFARPTFPELYDVPEKVMAVQVCGNIPRAVYDNHQLVHNHSMSCFVPWHYLKGVVNKSISKAAKYRCQDPKGDREEREKISQQFHLKYVLAIMNSAFAREWLAGRRRSKLHIYPDDWKQLPIALIPMERQMEFVKLVDAILAEFERHGYPLPPDAAKRVEELERQIDEQVAKLYGLVQR